MWPASAAQAADWPRLAEARGSPEHALVLLGASGVSTVRSLYQLVFDLPYHLGMGFLYSDRRRPSAGAV